MKKSTTAFIAIKPEVLKDAMNKKVINLTKLSAMLGVSDTAVSQWVNGQSRMSRKYIGQVCAILDITEDDLELKEIPKPEPVTENTKEEGATDHGRYPWGKDEGKVFSDADLMGRYLDEMRSLIDEERKQKNELLLILKNTIDILSDRCKVDTAQLAAVTMEACNKDFSNFKSNINRLCKKVLEVNSDYKTQNEVLSDAYALLRKEYGVVWEQEKKDFVSVNGRAPVSTLELEFWIESTKPAHENLLSGKIDTLCHKHTVRK